MSTNPLPPSEIIGGFLRCLREFRTTYNCALSEQQEQDAQTQDVLHELELQAKTYRETAMLGKELRIIRERRREAKETTELLQPIVEYCETNQAQIKALERLQGALRREEENQSRPKYYRPRSARRVGNVEAQTHE